MTNTGEKAVCSVECSKQPLRLAGFSVDKPYLRKIFLPCVAFALLALLALGTLPCLSLSALAQTNSHADVGFQAAARQQSDDMPQQTPYPNIIMPAALPQWQKLAEGLDLLALALEHDSAKPDELTAHPALSPDVADIAIVRADPALYEFTLHMASEKGRKSSLGELAREHGLYAAINASMYQADQMTSTGYMQSASHTNNSHIATRFGAFFLAEPKRPGPAPALLVEKNSMGSPIHDTIDEYNIIIQNFRLISSAGKILWPESVNRHSISALSIDEEGRLLLIISRKPFSAPEFARALQQLAVGAKLTMYLEGGVECGLLARDTSSEDSYYIWRGKHNGLLEINGSAAAALPNVLGLRPRVRGLH